MNELDPPIILTPAATATASVIWLHGLGADGNDFAPIVPMLGRPTEYTRFIFPHAPMVPVSINQGFVMRAWYDIGESNGQLVSDEAGIMASSKILCDLIDAEIDDGIAPERIVVAGFSQGGAIAQHTALTYPARLAGLLALSTYLPHPETLSARLRPANSDLPIFMAHGTRDPMLTIDRAEQSRDALISLGFTPRWETYDMEHAVCPREIADIGAWLGEVIPATG